MRFLLAVLQIILLAFIAEYFLPWWSVAIPAFAIAFFMRMRAGGALLVGFLSIFLLWLGAGLWQDIPNHHILANRMGDVLHLGKNGFVFLLVSSIIGGLVGALAAWSGAQVRRISVA